MSKSSSEVNPLLVSAESVAEMLGISVRHVYSLSSGGLLPCPVRLGRAVRWRREEIEKWVAAGMPRRSIWEKMLKE